MSQIGKNKTKNAKVLKDFFEELCVLFRLACQLPNNVTRLPQ